MAFTIKKTIRVLHSGGQVSQKSIKPIELEVQIPIPPVNLAVRFHPDRYPT